MSLARRFRAPALRRWPRRVLRAWRSSLQFRAVAITVLLSGIAIGSTLRKVNSPLLVVVASAGLWTVWQHARHRAWLVSGLTAWLGVNIFLLTESPAIKAASRWTLARLGLW